MEWILVDPTPEEMCDLLCGKPEEDVRMSRYIIEYRKAGDEYAECHRYYVDAHTVDEAIAEFRYLCPKSDSEIVEVSKLLKKDFSKM